MSARADIENCGYDGAGAVLTHMYGGFNGETALLPPTAADPANLIEFDQSASWSPRTLSPARACVRG